MRLGVFAVLFSDRGLEEALDQIAALGCQAVEIGTGGYVGDAHCDPKALLADADARARLVRATRERDLEISALSCHGNALHPDPELAEAHDAAFRDSLRLAGELGIEAVVTFSGCPGGSPGATRPNWVTCPWPDDFAETLEWQWNERVGPYWSEAADFARERGVRVAVELHPGFVVYHTASFHRLRAVAGDAVGVNFDPSHLFWQQMDPLTCVRELGNAILHVHAKDTRLDPANVARNGVLDTTSYAEPARRSWSFRTVGYGHDEGFWRDLVSELRLVGYDGVLSIEHEDPLMSRLEGLTRAVASLKASFIGDPPDAPWWTT